MSDVGCNLALSCRQNVPPCQQADKILRTKFLFVGSNSAVIYT
jgi:hypothetical protein